MGVTRSQLSMHELGTRELPTAALVKHSQLQIHFSKDPKEKSSGPAVTDETQKQLENLLAETQYQIRNTKRKLEKFESKIALGENVKRVNNFVTEKNAAAKPGERPLVLHSKQSASLLKHLDPVAHFKLRLKLESLEFELGMIEEEVKRMLAGN